MAYQKRLYKLINLDSFQELVLDGSGTNNEPKNWEDSERTIKRSTKNFSVTTELSKNLEFTGAGASFLINAYNQKSIEARVKMYEYRFNPKTGVPYIYSVGDFNFSKFSLEKNVVKVPFESGTLNALVKAKLNNKFELNRTESIDGITIPDLVTSEFAGINRALDLKSLLETGEDDRSSSFLIKNNESNNYNYGIVSYPMDIIYESDDRVTSVVQSVASEGGGDSFDFFIQGSTASMMYYNNDRRKSINIKLEGIDFDYKLFIPQVFPIVTWSVFLGVAKFKGGEDPFLVVTDPDYFYEIDELTPYLTNNTWTSFSYSKDFNIDLDAGESLQFGVFVKTENLGTGNVADSFLRNTFGSVKFQELSQRNDINRRTKCVRNNEVGRTLMGLINGDKDTYKSEFFESSDFKNTAITNGKLIRGFDELDVTTSLKEFLDNSSSLFNMAYNFEVINGKETLVHEPLKHFFRSQTIIEIKEQVNKVKRTPALEFVYSTIKSGYKKPSGDNLYEEVNGLNEFNTSNEYTAPITREVKEYDIESPYRADSEGKELTFRQNIIEFPTSDYRTDTTIFNLDLKESGTSVFEERTWQDDYEEAPKNVFSPDTVTGLRLTPFRNMSRHFWLLNSAFTKFTEKYIRYASTRGNSDLITKKAGEAEVKENGNFQIKSLENAIFVNEWIEFEYPLTFELLQQVNGFTDVNGRKIPNTYFKLSFINEFNQKESGYLFDLKPNKQGKWKLLKAL